MLYFSENDDKRDDILILEYEYPGFSMKSSKSPIELRLYRKDVAEAARSLKHNQESRSLLEVDFEMKHDR